MVDNVPYNTRCRIATPMYFREGIFRPTESQGFVFSLLEIAALTLQTKNLETTESRGIDTFIEDVAQKRIVRFLFYSSGHPCTDLYDLDRLGKNPVLKVVPTFNTDEMTATFPLHRLEGLCASLQLRLAGIKGPNSYIQKKPEEHYEP